MPSTLIRRLARLDESRTAEDYAVILIPGEWNHGASHIQLCGRDDRETFDAILEQIHQEHASFGEFWNHNTVNLED